MRRRMSRVARAMCRGGMTVVTLVAGLALGAGMAAESLDAQATGGASRDPRYRGIVCENNGRTASAEFTDAQGNVHQLWYENYGFRTGNPDDPGGWFEMGKSGPGSQLPSDHRISGSFDDGRHALNGDQHSAQEDLDHGHAYNMMLGLLNICNNTEG